MSPRESMAVWVRPRLLCAAPGPEDQGRANVSRISWRIAPATLNPHAARHRRWSGVACGRPQHAAEVAVRLWTAGLHGLSQRPEKGGNITDVMPDPRQGLVGCNLGL